MSSNVFDLTQYLELLTIFKCQSSTEVQNQFFDAYNDVHLQIGLVNSK